MRSPLGENLRIAEQGAALVFLGNDRIGSGDRPWNGEIGIVPQDRALAFGRVTVADLIEECGVGLERGEPVRETDGDEQALARTGAQLDGDMLAERRRGLADVDRDIERSAMNDLDELGLRLDQLIVEAAHDALGRDGEIVLLPVECEACVDERLAAKRFLKGSARIAIDRPLNDHDSGDARFSDFQCESSCGYLVSVTALPQGLKCMRENSGRSISNGPWLKPPRYFPPNSAARRLLLPPICIPKVPRIGFSRRHISPTRIR